MRSNHFDVIIIGGGPAGTACAMQLSTAMLSVALLEKATFPRDKICGDGLSVDVINQLDLLSPGLSKTFRDLQQKEASYGVTLYSPDHNKLDIPFIYKNVKTCGYVSTRLQFDDVLFQHVKRNHSQVKVYEDCAVKKVTDNSDYISIETNQGTYTCALVIGADGAHSQVLKHLGNNAIDKAHYAAGIRTYFQNVQMKHADNFIELHFFKEILPGYFWIFPLNDNTFNVGMGMLSSKVAKHNVDLKKVFTHLIKTHPGLKDRFADAKQMEGIKGFGLPLGSKKRKLSGNRYLLTGDAAALIDPFSGEGIANAIRSGRVAAAHALACFNQHNFSADFNKAYDKEIYKRMWSELRVSSWLLKLVSFPWAFNFAIKRANQSKYVQHFIVDALSNIESKKKVLFKPSFYYRMLFK